MAKAGPQKHLALGGVEACCMGASRWSCLAGKAPAVLGVRPWHQGSVSGCGVEVAEFAAGLIRRPSQLSMLRGQVSLGHRQVCFLFPISLG